MNIWPAICLSVALACVPASASDFSPTFKRSTDRALEEFFASSEKAQLTAKLTSLRDHGGLTQHPSVACVTTEKYDQYLRAQWGQAHFYPTNSECWQTDYNEPVRATGACVHVGSSFAISESTLSVLVCEFTTTSWFGSPFWIKADDVSTSSDPPLK